jgi:hypothetical protein
MQRGRKKKINKISKVREIDEVDDESEMDVSEDNKEDMNVLEDNEEELDEETDEEDEKIEEKVKEEKKIDNSKKLPLISSNIDGKGNKDPIYKSILEKNKKLKDRIEEVAKYIYKFDKMYFYFSDEGKETWIERHYPEVKIKRKLIIKKVNRLYNQDLKN